MAPELKQQLVAELTKTIGEMKVVSLSLISSDEISGGYKEGDGLEVLAGEAYYSEILCGLKFRVSPFAFF